MVNPLPAASLRDVHLERGLVGVGVLPQLLRDPIGFLSRVARAHPGEVFAVRLGPIQLHIVSHPDHVQQVLHDHPRDFGKGGMWSAVRDLLGNGLVTSEGDFWLRQRRMMQPLFSGKHLASLAEGMVEVIEGETRRLQEAPPDIDMAAEMASLTERILLQTMFGAGVEVGEADRLGKRLLEAMRVLNLKLFTYFLPRWVPIPGGRTFRRATAAIDEALLKIVGDRRKSGQHPNDLLSLLLHARDEGGSGGMDDRQLRDELVTLFVAGNDTTANALTWLWYVLDRHPEIDRRVRDEVREALGDRRPTHEDLPHLAYLKLVLQETLRLYPPVWMFPRFCEQDRNIGGFRVPAGSALLLVPWITHRDPAFWERPEEFEPERFLPERSAARPRYAYFPFGGGPRQCIGNAFALMEAQLIAAMMIRCFRPRLAARQDVVPSSQSTLKPKGGMKMRLERVERS
jgi:cytochrome P450